MLRKEWWKAAYRDDRVRVGLAGHPAILQFCARSNEVKKWECPNMPLGIVPEGDFVSTEIPAESGDQVNQARLRAKRRARAPFCAGARRDTATR